MCSRHDDTDYIRDREKLFSSDVITVSRATNLVCSSSFYNARLASKSYFLVLNQTHLVSRQRCFVLGSNLAPNA